MLTYPDIDPVIIGFGPVALRWYGLMYLLGFATSYFLIRIQINEEYGSTGKSPGEAFGRKSMECGHLEGLMVWLVIGIVLGGRLGYVLFYNFPYFISHPQEILATWHGGMSFHGGVLGAVAGGGIHTLRHGLDFWKWADRIIVTAPIGLGLGRIGNFINGELYGRPADVPWAMIFPQGGLVARHPSQLYEAFLEGVLLFVVLWPLRHRPWATGRKLALFLMLYAICRIIAEFFREPDPQLGFIMFRWLTMGQILSILFFGAGILIWWRRKTVP